jgi:8-amino-7-oxononanoate synthase
VNTAGSSTKYPEPEAWIDPALEALKSQDLLRYTSEVETNAVTTVMDGRTYINFSSNDYLGLAGHPRLVKAGHAALDALGTSARASRLVHGTLSLHEEAEAGLAAFKGTESALLFGSGYLANIGIIPALVGRDDVIFADKLCHASLIDGIQLSRAKLYRFAHNNTDDLARLLADHRGKGKALIITESVFSMDGDLAPLREIAELAEQHGAMTYVDEAHAAGVFGPQGAGRVSELGLSSNITISMGTLSKALGSYGGYAACSSSMRDWLINRARSFIYSTALPPIIPAMVIESLAILTEEPDMGPRLLQRARAFRKMLQKNGLQIGPTSSQIIPIIMGNQQAALTASARLKERGILVTAMRPPTVPKGTSRLRVSLSLAHSDSHIELFRKVIIEACHEAMYP